VKREAKSVRCTRDARQIPWQSYVLAGEGNKARDRAVAEQRCSLALRLSTFANPDGTSIETGIERLMNITGWSKATVHRRLDELEELGLLSNHGLTKERGTRVRHLDFSRMKFPGAGVSPLRETSGQGAGVSRTIAGVSRTIARVSPIGETQPKNLTENPNRHSPSKSEKQHTLGGKNSRVVPAFKTKSSSRTKKGAPIPADFVVKEKHRTLARSLGVDVDAAFKHFRDYWLDKAGVSADWDAKFSYWLRNEPKFKERRNGNPKGEELTNSIVEARESARAAIKARG